MARSRGDPARRGGATIAFWRGAARLEGDWPASWRRGWVYDIETTRMCVYPPGGIFTDVWPAWMIQWPRAVVAEGTLDMARLAYASPELAQRAVLSLFRDATAPNVPCVFQHGEPNMVASDGSVCGTSPAWCVPFYNLERLFSLTLDTAWLAEIYPYLSLYLEWWLAERTDRGRLGRLQVHLGGRRGRHAAPGPRAAGRQRRLGVRAAGRASGDDGALGRGAGAVRGGAGRGRRTQARWRDARGRVPGPDARALGPGRAALPGLGRPNERFLAAGRRGELLGDRPVPVLGAGVHAAAGRPRTTTTCGPGSGRELQQYDGPPWTLWASWSYVVLEAAPDRDRRPADRSRGGWRRGSSGGSTTSLTPARSRQPSHPTPGVAREYWPLDLDTWASCEGYGWGANTASLLVRQVFGFLESEAPEGLRFRLAPCRTAPTGRRMPW